MNRLFLGGMLSVALALPACGSRDNENDEERWLAEADRVSQDAERGGETYDEYDERRDSYQGSRGTFMGDGCTVDCGGHEAGYEWAADNGITDPDECGGNSWSFIEGCQAYAEEQQ